MWRENYFNVIKATRIDLIFNVQYLNINGFSFLLGGLGKLLQEKLIENVSKSYSLVFVTDNVIT